MRTKEESQPGARDTPRRPRRPGAARHDPRGLQPFDRTYETLLADLSLELAALSVDEIESTLGSVLERVRDAFGCDRVTYCGVGRDGTLAVLSCAVGGPWMRWPVGPLDEALPWLSAQLRSGRVVALSDVAAELPGEAQIERLSSARLGLRSHLSIPLRVGASVTGSISFASVTRTIRWSPRAIRRLLILGELLATSLARVHTEREALVLRDRIEAADRVTRTATLASAIGHELNQPLSALLLNAHTALRHLADGRAPTQRLDPLLRAVARDAARARDAVRAMRRMMRRDRPAYAPIDLAEVVAEVVRLMRPDLRRHAVTVEAHAPPGWVVRADKAQLQQVVVNLVQNAIAAMAARPDGRRRLRWEVASRTDGWVDLTLEDTGPGIGEADREAVFAPRWSGHDNGPGIGLAICRSIVEAHGGSIEATPIGTLGGACVRVRLAVAQHGARETATGQADVTPPAAWAPVAHDDPAAPLVSVVDNDTEVSRSLSRLLADQGWRVRCHASGAAFLADLGQDAPDCAVVDVDLPDIDGIELHARLRALAHTLPVVFLTASDEVGHAVEAMRHGAADYLEKPAPAEAIIAAVRHALEQGATARRQARDEAADRERLARLTPRERQVMTLVATGQLNKQVADALGITEATVKQHRGRVMQKLGLRRAADLVRLGQRLDPTPARGTAGAP